MLTVLSDFRDDCTCTYTHVGISQWLCLCCYCSTSAACIVGQRPRTSNMDPYTTAIQKIQDNSNQPEEWLEFLAHQRTRAGPDLTVETCQHLIFLYEKAVNQISAEEHKRSFSYARLLVECAKLQM